MNPYYDNKLNIDNYLQHLQNQSQKKQKYIQKKKLKSKRSTSKDSHRSKNNKSGVQ